MVSKAKALELLHKLVSRAGPLKNTQRFSPQFTQWQHDGNAALANIFGEASRQLEAFKKVRYSLSISSNATPESDYQERYTRGVSDAEAVLASAISEIENYWTAEDRAPPEPLPASSIDRVRRICERFPAVAHQLTKRHGHRDSFVIIDEYDVQDLLHALLYVEFDDIRPEEWVPSYAGSSSRMDFLLKSEEIVIETKKTREGLGAREIGEELIVDIEKYKQHPSCKSLICLVYDPEHRITNPVGLANDLNRSEPIPVTVHIVPRRF